MANRRVRMPGAADRRLPLRGLGARLGDLEAAQAATAETLSLAAGVVGEVQQASAHLAAGLAALAARVEALAAPSGEPPSDALARAIRSLAEDPGDSARAAAADRHFEALVRESLRQKFPAGPIVFVCRDLRRRSGMEAITNHLIALGNAMRPGWSGASLRLVSMEAGADGVQQSPDQTAVWCPPEHLGELLRAWRPAVVHLFEASAAALFWAGECLLDYNVVLTASGRNPLEGLSGEQLEELRHQTDHGKVRLVVVADAIFREVEAAGVLPRAVIRPAVVGFEPAPPRTPSAPGVVGFASSPELSEQGRARGIPLLLEVAARRPEVSFLLAWRSDASTLRRELAGRGLGNVTVLEGRQDMRAFYAGVDAVLLPFVGRDGQHGCPLSGVEALLSRRPVLCTSEVGLAEVVGPRGWGAVAEATPEALCRALDDLWRSYSAVVDRMDPAAVAALFDPAGQAQAYEAIYRELMEPVPVPTLRRWRSAIAGHGRELVKGEAALRAHYAATAVATSYHGDRFAAFPHDVFDRQERTAIRMVVQALAAAQPGPVRVLDVATGDGRILAELCGVATCTGLDSSVAMLAEARRRLGSRAGDVALVAADFFDYEAPQPFDVVTLFRYVRHYDYRDRRRIFHKLADLVRPGGYVLMDAPNRRLEWAVRLHHGWTGFPIYDVFWSLEDLEREACQLGFTLREAIPVGRGLLAGVAQPEEPMTWVAVLQAPVA